MKKFLRVMISMLAALVFAGLTGCAGVSKAKGPLGADNSDGSARTLGADPGQPLDEAAADTESPRDLLRAPANHTYYFSFDGSAVKQTYLASVRAQADYLLHHPRARIRLEGHTDARGSREYNIALGWRRAKAIAQLIKRQGVSSKQLVLVSYGKERPVAFGANERAWQQNRRTVLVYEAR